MRVSLVLPALLLATPAKASMPPLPAGPSATQCQKTTSYLADANGAYRGKGLAPQQLGKLPPATAYKAVYRHIGGCEAPLTVSDYRRTNRR